MAESLEHSQRPHWQHPHLLQQLQHRATEDWLIGSSSRQLSERATQRQQALLANLANPTALLLAEAEPIEFLATLVAAVAAGCPIFLANPHSCDREQQQLLNLLQSHSTQPPPSQSRNSTSPNNHQNQPGIDSKRSNVYPPPTLHPNLQKAATHLAPFTLYPDRLPPSAHLQLPSAAASPILIPTGGSSGQVRFAIHTWETLTASVAGFSQYFRLERINSYCVLPLYHVSGLMQFLRSFTSGGRLAIQPFKALAAGERLDLDPTTFFISLVPTQLQRLLDRGLGDWLARFQTVLLGGAPAWPALLERARQQQIPLAPTYGMTETASQIATLKPTDFLKGDRSCGPILPHATVTIRNPEGAVLGTGAVGAIAIQAKSLALGYYPHSCQFDLASQPYFQTDDLGYLDPNGHLHITGRNTEKIITGGENVFPTEVEAVIRASNLVADICVFGLPSQEWGEVVAAAYVPKDAASSSIESLKTAIKPQLSNFKQPKHWFALEKLPRNAQGKINRQQVKKIVCSIP